MCDTKAFFTFLFRHEYLIFLFKLIFVSLLAGLLGLERERKGQAAGLRTHIILTIGAMLAMNLSFFLSEQFPRVTVDRIPAQVISGIGFLGAGAILRYGVSIKGLTTAAGLWGAAIIGLAVGAGFYVPAALTTLTIFFSITILDIIEKKLTHTKHSLIINLIFQAEKVTCKKIAQEFKNYDISFIEVNLTETAEKKESGMEFRLSLFEPI